jgi:hypothetical protein
VQPVQSRCSAVCAVQHPALHCTGSTFRYTALHCTIDHPDYDYDYNFGDRGLRRTLVGQRSKGDSIWNMGTPRWAACSHSGSWNRKAGPGLSLIETGKLNRCNRFRVSAVQCVQCSTLHCTEPVQHFGALHCTAPSTTLVL